MGSNPIARFSEIVQDMHAELDWLSRTLPRSRMRVRLPSGALPEGIRLDEDTVLKTAGANALQGSSPWPSAPFTNLVLWPSGEGTCLTNRGSTVRIRPGLLFNDQHQPVLRGRCLQNIFRDSNLDGAAGRTRQHGPSVQFGVDATLSRWRSPVQIRYGLL